MRNIHTNLIYDCRLVIGLFGLVGVLGVFTAPLIGRTIDHLVPWFAIVLSTLGLIVFQAIQTGAGGIHIAAVVIVCFGRTLFDRVSDAVIPPWSNLDGRVP